MNNSQQWQAANTARATLYRWFAELFARELTKTNLTQLQAQYPSLHAAFSDLNLEPQSAALQTALENLQVIPAPDRALELAADFAHLFLLSGHQSAPPYASYYLESDQMLYGKPAQQMSEFLASHKLDLHPEFREPKDHLSIYLQVMSLWIKSSVDEQVNLIEMAVQQQHFLEDALLSWLPKFAARCQHIRVKTQVYPAIIDLLLHFVQEDRQALEDMAEAE